MGPGSPVCGPPNRRSGRAAVDALVVLARRNLRFVGRVDQAVCGAPSSPGVTVATGYGYRRPDGVGVVPVTALGP